MDGRRHCSLVDPLATAQAAAASAGLERIDAKIGRGNDAAFRYYEVLGFHTYREEADTIHKVFEIKSDAI